MATEKIGIYRRWLEKVPKVNGKPAPKSEWPKYRRHSWTVRWFGNAGKRYSRSFKTRKLADYFARKLQTDVNQARPDKPDKITFSAFAKEHKKVMAGQVAYATLCDQIRALKLFEKFIDGSTFLTNIRPRQAEAFIAHRLASGVTIPTANKDIRTLKRIFNLAIDPRGYLQEGQNPFGKIKQRKKSPQPVRYVKITEFQALLNATKKLWWKSLISIAYGSGLRRSEIFNLTWQDIDFESKLIRINAKKSTELTIEWESKDHQNRIVPISEHTIGLLTKLQLNAPEGHPYIFITSQRFKAIKNKEKTGKWNPICEAIGNVSRNFEMIRKRAGVAKCTLHDFRRSAITNWANYLPIHVVQQFAGHSNITTTRKYYLSVRPEDIITAGQVFNKIMEGVNSD
ncbi:tyrosine-type recombinase/integrase [Planctomycetota bacterium]